VAAGLAVLFFSNPSYHKPAQEKNKSYQYPQSVSAEVCAIVAVAAMRNKVDRCSQQAKYKHAYG